MIFAGINTLGRPGSPLKIKGVSQDISVRFRGIDSEDCGLGPDL